MVDYEHTIQKIISSIINFTFEFDIEEIKSKMNLKEISDEEIDKIGEEKLLQILKREFTRLSYLMEK